MERPAGLKRYPVPWSAVLSLGPHIWHRTPTSVDRFSASVLEQLSPAPKIECLDLVPENPRFILAANHYQRPGLWILHPASLLTQAMRRRFGPGDPPVRWIVTANWPPVRVLGREFPSPGDWLLPRVADALECYPVAFAGTNPSFTARSLRRILRDAEHWNRPLGIFPEGVGGSAHALGQPIPGVDRLVAHLAKRGLGVVPAGIREEDRLVARFGPYITPAELGGAANAAELVMQRIGDLLTPARARLAIRT